MHSFFVVTLRRRIVEKAPKVVCFICPFVCFAVMLVVTTGAEDVQSSSQIVTTNKRTPSCFYRPDALPVTQPTAVKH